MEEAEWQAIQSRDSRYDGKFWYGAGGGLTYCRPSCKSRHPKRDHVLIFYSPAEAEANGRIPCRRCRPDLTDWEGNKKELAAKAKLLIENRYKEKFSLDELANQLYINKNHLVRTFKEQTGQTLLQYHHLVRCKQARKLMEDPDLTLEEIAYQTGYTSSSHFSRIFREIYGDSPAAWRRRCLTRPADRKLE